MNKKIKIAIAITGIAVASIAGFLFWQDYSVRDLPELTNAFSQFPEEVLDDEEFDMLNFFNDLLDVEPIERPDIIGDYKVVGGKLIEENLGFDQETRDSNYLASEDFIKEFTGKKISFDGEYLKLNGIRQGYRTYTMDQMEIASTDGSSAINKYEAKDGYMRMFADPNMFYIDLKMEDSDATEDVLSMYNDEFWGDEEAMNIVVDMFISSIKQEVGYLGIFAVSDEIEDEILAYTKQDPSKFTNRDYAMNEALKILNKELTEKFGENWNEKITTDFDYVQQRVKIMIGEKLFADLMIRYSTLFDEFELTHVWETKEVDDDTTEDISVEVLSDYPLEVGQ